MTRARSIADLLDANGDVKSSALDNVPASNDASALTTGTIDNARISLDANEIPNLDTAKITSGTFVDARLPSTALNSNVKSAFKNIIINGGMDLAQRSTSVSGLTSSSTYHTIDRFATELGSNGTWTQSQSTDVPTGQGFSSSLKMDCTATGSGGYLHITQRFEGRNLQYLKKGTANAESLTVSFWVKSTKTGTYIAEFRDLDNTRNISKSYTISSANTWEKKTITYDGDTSGAFGNDTNASLELNLWLCAGTGNTSGTLQTSWASQVAVNRAVGQVNLGDSTSNEWYITGLQVEVGDASDFEFLPIDVVRHRCERYCRLFGSGVQGRASGTQHFYFSEPMYPEMRATPTLTLKDTSVGVGNYVSYDKVSSNGSLDLTRSSRTGIVSRISGYTGLTGSDQLQVWHNLTDDNWLMATAEL